MSTFIQCEVGYMGQLFNYKGKGMKFHIRP